MPRVRFGLRLLLALPVCIAAFYGGWNAHRMHLSALHNRDASASLRRQAALWSEIEEIRSKQQLHADNMRDDMRDSVDRIEHGERMKAFERMLQDPIKARMFPSGEF